MTAVVICLISCGKENFDIIVPEDPEFDPIEQYNNSLIHAVTPGNSNSMALGCVQINFPVSLRLRDNQVLVVNDYEEFQTALDSENATVIDFLYPVEGIDHTGAVSTFESALSLATSKASCVPKNGWATSQTIGTIAPAFLMDSYCLELSYPVSLTDQQGASYTAESEEEFVELTLTNPDLYFVLPLNVQSVQSTMEIGSMQEMFDAFSVCSNSQYQPLFTGANGNSGDPFDCFSFIYPIDVLIIEPDTITTVNDEDELVLLSMAGDSFELIYPVDIQDSTGMVTTLDSDMDLGLAFIDCWGFIDTTSVDPCDVEAHILLFFNGLNILTTNHYTYEMNYPITIEVNGTQVVLNEDDDYLPAIGGSPFSPESAVIVYPVSVTQFGQSIEMNNDQEVCDFVGTLSEPCINKPAHVQLFHNTFGVPISCSFGVEFPMNLERNGVQITILNSDDYFAELNTPGAYDELTLEYPVSVLKYDNGLTITFQSDTDVCDYLDNCF